MKTGKMKTRKMKTSINLKTRKMKNNYLKLGMMAAVMLSASIGFAQTDPADAGTVTGIQKGNGAGESIKVIDNKGTIKYLQTNNGITSITSTLGGNRTTTTWQLGGELTDATYIDATSAIFALDGIALETGAASTNAVTGETAKGGASASTGYTFLVRDEATGATKKLLLSDLISSGRTDYTALAADETANAGTFTSAGMPIDDSKVSVYRNGAKLRAGTDYTLSLVATVATVTLVPQGGAPGDWVIYEDDQFEVHWIKF
jgi:hypothetical protein